MRVKLAGIQMACSDNTERNLRKAVEMAEYALEKGAKILCYQQLFHLPWFPADTVQERFELAEDDDGPTITKMRQIAKDGNAVVVCPVFEKTGDGRYFNTAVVINADGSIAGRYRKVHVPDLPLWREKFYFSPGDTGFPVFETAYGRIGVQLCWDVFFPEGFRALALKGAQIILTPTAAAFASHSRWEKMLTAAAIANGVFIFRINRVGGTEQQRFYGKSFLVNPFGEIIVEPTGKADAVVMADADFEEIAEARETHNFFGDRRPGQYGDLLGGQL